MDLVPGSSVSEWLDLVVQLMDRARILTLLQPV